MTPPVVYHCQLRLHDSKGNANRQDAIKPRLVRSLDIPINFVLFARAAEAEAKKREQQAMLANRGMFLAGTGNANGAAAGVGHVKPLSYGTYGKRGEIDDELHRYITSYTKAS